MAEILEFNKMFYTNFEPKMKNRYILEWDGVPGYMVKAAARPSIQFETITLDHINIKRKLQGKGEWQDITITLYDPIVPSAAQSVMEWVRLGHESITGRRGYADFYKKDLDFYMLGPVGDKIEQWKIKGAFIQQANFGDVSFDSNEPATIELTLSYDYAILEY
jgi:predicted GNAT family acetyltransferase